MTLIVITTMSVLAVFARSCRCIDYPGSKKTGTAPAANHGSSANLRQNTILVPHIQEGVVSQPDRFHDIYPDAALTGYADAFIPESGTSATCNPPPPPDSG